MAAAIPLQLQQAPPQALPIPPQPQQAPPQALQAPQQAPQGGQGLGGQGQGGHAEEGAVGTLERAKRLGATQAPPPWCGCPPSCLAQSPARSWA